ncbi:MAG: dienelactone hydrolase family protein [Sphingomonadaceae bacterium]
MCEESDLEHWGAAALTRRQLGVFGAAGTLAACASGGTGGKASQTSQPNDGVAENAVEIPTSDGTLDGVLFSRSGRKAPGVLFWPDIAGIRPANRQMAKRLATAGYTVLLANPYYRDVHGQQFADFADFAGNGGFKKVTPWREKFSAGSVMHDAAAAFAWLDQQDTVDTARKLGTQGYCMTGGFALWGAGAAPERVGAAASFHGAGLVRKDELNGPQAMFAKNPKAHYLVLIAQNDDAKAPDDKNLLKSAAETAGAQAEIAVYPADHGWTVPDSPSYNEAQAERAWQQLLETYKTSL